MKRLICKGVAMLCLPLALGAAACAAEPRVIVHTAGGDVAVTVEVAATPERQSLGLMYRKQLPESAGMLFVFAETAEHSFWMKNTVLALDMIFIGDDHRIVGIVRDAVPFTTNPRTVGAPSRYVLEVNAGFSDRHGLQRGDRVTFEHVPATQ